MCVNSQTSYTKKQMQYYYYNIEEVINLSDRSYTQIKYVNVKYVLLLTLFKSFQKQIKKRETCYDLNVHQIGQQT